MTTNQPQRYGGLLGVVGGALALGGTFALTTVEFMPDAAEAVASFTDDSGRLLGGSQILVIGALLLASFGAVMQRRIRTAAPDSVLSTVAVAGYVGAAVAAGVGAGSLAAGALRGDTDGGISEVEATTLFDIGFISIGGLMPALLALGVGASALASVTHADVLPSWLGWLGLPISVGLVILPINWAVSPIALVWTIVAGVMLSSSPTSVVDVTADRVRESVPA